MLKIYTNADMIIFQNSHFTIRQFLYNYSFLNLTQVIINYCEFSKQKNWETFEVLYSLIFAMPFPSRNLFRNFSDALFTATHRFYFGQMLQAVSRSLPQREKKNNNTASVVVYSIWLILYIFVL